MTRQKPVWTIIAMVVTPAMSYLSFEVKSGGGGGLLMVIATATTGRPQRCPSLREKGATPQQTHHL